MGRRNRVGFYGLFKPVTTTVIATNWHCPSAADARITGRKSHGVAKIFSQQASCLTVDHHCIRRIEIFVKNIILWQL